VTPGGSRPVVVTDLDGTLLDETTYAWDAARPALVSLRERGVDLVLASSKTRAEMERLARHLEVDAPLIVENGGAVVVPRRWAAGGAPAGADADPAGWVVTLGAPRDRLVAGLADIAATLGTRLTGFASLSTADVQRLTGLPAEAAAAAMSRAYDEPFLLDDPARLADVSREAHARGFAVTRGGRFFHLTGPTDKGRALRALLEAAAGQGLALTTIVLGDSANDGPMLAIADRPIVVPRPGGVAPALAGAFAQAECAPAPGPAGWNAAVLAALEGAELPRVAQYVPAVG
jgi:mannosyl-3-phosphoglycerate phosphatase